MLFKFPKKKIVLDCFTSESYVIEFAPIHYAIKHMPEWWKKLPVDLNNTNQRNMKNCVGMVDYYKRSVALPMWSDLKIYLDKNSIGWQFSDKKSFAEHHDRAQYANFLGNYMHIKIESPWAFQSDKNVDWVWSHPTYNYAHNDDAVSLPGLVNYYYQHNTNINLMLRADTAKEITINQGQPMAVLTPMSDKKVEIVRHLVSRKKMEQLRDKSISFTFFKIYKRAIKQKNKFENCPYHEE